MKSRAEIKIGEILYWDYPRFKVWYGNTYFPCKVTAINDQSFDVLMTELDIKTKQPTGKLFNRRFYFNSQRFLTELYKEIPA